MIAIFAADAADFSCNGLSALSPSSCVVTETLNGEWELSLTHPLDDWGKWSRLQVGNIIKTPVPSASSPRLMMLSQLEGRAIYRISTSGVHLSLHSDPGSGYPVLNKYKNGLEVIVLSTADPAYYEVLSPDGLHGFMASASLVYQRTVASKEQAIKEVLVPRELREQPFRIYRIVPELTQVTAYARHISYDLMDNMVFAYKPANGTSGAVAARELISHCQSSHRFTMHSNLTAHVSNLSIENTNPMDALLSDGGLAEMTGSELTRDWYDLYLLERVGRDTDIQIREGKNLLGISYDVDDANVVTRIVPTGETEDGQILYLDSKHVDSPNIATYPHPRWMHLQVSDARVSDEMTVAQAKAKLQAAAQEAFDKGCDLPDISLNVDFINVGETLEYAQYKPLTDIFLGDSVKVIVKTLGLEISLRLTDYSYDCLKKRYNNVTLGMASATVAGSMISPRQLPTGSIRGMKLAMGSIGTGHLQTASIGSLQVKTAAIRAAHIQQAAIGQAHIEDAAITNAKIGTAAITSGKIDQAAIGTVHIQDGVITSAKIYSGEVETLKIQAANIADAAITNAKIDDASITSAKIQEAAIGIAHIQDGIITHAKIYSGEADELKIQTANIANAAILSVKIADGTITSVKIQNGTIDAINIKDAAIETAKIQDGSVTNLKIYHGLADELKIQSANIAAASIQEANIANAAITSAKISDAAIVSAKIGEAAVDNIHIVEGAVDTINIRDGAIVNAKISEAAIDDAHIRNGVITSLKLYSGTAGELKIQNAHIASAAIDTTQIQNAAITNALIAQEAVGTAQIADGSITDAKIVELTANKINAGTLDVERLIISGNDQSIVYALNNIGELTSQSINTLDGDTLTPRSITADKIVAKSVTAAEIASSTITANEILAGTITGNEIAANTITAGNIQAGAITVDQVAASFGSLLDLSSNEGINLKVSGIEGKLSDKANNADLDTYAKTADMDTRLASELTVVNNKITSKFTEASGIATNAQTGLTQFRSLVESWQEFSPDGLRLGRSDSPYQVLLSNTKLSFLQDGAEIAYISNNKLYITASEVVNQFVIGNDAEGYMTLDVTDGGLSATWRNKE